MQSISLDAPSGPAIPADAKSCGRSSYDDIGTSNVSTHFVHVLINPDRRIPCGAAVGRTWNATDMHVSQECSAVACRGHGANAEWRAEQLAVEERGSCIPRVTPRYVCESADVLEMAGCAQPQYLGVVRANVNLVGNGHDA